MTATFVSGRYAFEFISNDEPISQRGTFTLEGDILETTVTEAVARGEIRKGKGSVNRQKVTVSSEKLTVQSEGKSNYCDSKEGTFSVFSRE